ncbi:PDZ domain-containing protein [Sphingopyxis sp. PET50]|uniref:PDZ domain-containing protein n=1 Tax=Sphingopyxis sp. PET50 TaxID=2976533 RepID=UPI0021AE6900|nr:PDZ domain-containing protein [Sphingopyxis sp. PET50]
MAAGRAHWYQAAMRRSFLLPLSATAMLAASGAAHAAAEDGLAAQELRLATAGYRLTTGSAGWCPVTRPQPGWLLSDARRFGAREWKEAGPSYGAPGDGPFVAAIAPGSPADRAGLPRGATIAAIDGQSVPAARRRGDGPHRRGHHHARPSRPQRDANDH